MSEPSRELPDSERSVCPFCREPLHVSAVKCPHCHEFRPLEAKKQEDNNSALMLSSAILELVGKSLVPATILIIAFGFRPTFEALINRASEAQFLATKLVFSQTAAFKGALAPTELYYLIGCAKDYGREVKGGYNFDFMKSNGQDTFITSLQQKGLVDFKIVANVDKSATIFGKHELIMTPTEKGKQFLVELGLVFDGKNFVNAP